MIVTPHQDELQDFNRDGSTGMPYVVHLPNRTELYMVVPIRHWDNLPARAQAFRIALGGRHIGEGRS